jgi:UDP-glucose 4-epimerase
VKIAVTGGSGFIGSHVVDALDAAGHAVVNIDVRDIDRRAEFVDADIRNVEQLTEVFAEKAKDAVFHLAAVANAREALDDPVGAVDTNITGTACVLEAARRAGTKRVILASTVWYYNAVDPQGTPDQRGVVVLDETAPIMPSGGGHVYTTSKITSELLCHDFSKLYGTEFTVLRYGIPYGPRMWPGLALRAFMDKVFADEPITIFGDGSAVRRFLYVSDIARAHVLALSADARNQTYNLEGSRDVTIKELAETVIDRVGKGTIEYVIDPSRRGELSLAQIEISNRKAADELGWSPETELGEGVADTVDWYRANLAK